MGDKARFRLFADLISARFPTKSRVVDVASGKGQLQAALFQRGFRRVVSWDTRGRNFGPRRNYHGGLFDYRSAPRGYDLVVGMHPDAATDHIVAYAAKHRVPFIVCPCCVMPSASSFQDIGYDGWIRHLTALAPTFDIERMALPMTGRNLVLIGKPRISEKTVEIC